MARVKFYIGDVREHIRRLDVPETRQDLKFIRVSESDSFDGTYTVIDTVQINFGELYIYSDGASDDYLYRWYKLEFISDPNAVNPDTGLPVEAPHIYGTTDAVVPETVACIVDDIREWLGDTDLTNPAWPDKHYVHTIRFAIKQHKGEKNLTFIGDEDTVPIQILVRQEYALAIAYDHAKYYKLEAPAATLDKSQIMTHYLEMVKALDEHYREISRRLNLDGGGYDDRNIITQLPAPNVVDAIRFSRTTGTRVKGIFPSKYRRQEYFFSTGIKS